MGTSASEVTGRKIKRYGEKQPILVARTEVDLEVNAEETKFRVYVVVSSPECRAKS
jgi:hypothetical protein